MTDQNFCQILAIDYEQLRALRQGRSSPSLDELSRFCDHFELTMDQVVRGEIDYTALAKQYFGAHFALPERYLNRDHMRSRKRSLLSVQDYFRERGSLPVFDSVLRSLQVKPIFLESLNHSVSSILTTDFLQGLERHQFTGNEVFNMGAQVARTLNGTPLARRVRAQRTPKRVYEHVFENELESFEQLCSYHILRADHHSCTVAVRTRAETKDVFHTHVFGERSSCFFRRGIVASLVEMVGLPSCQVEEESCVFLGDTDCRYRLIWQKNVPLAN